MKFCLLWEEGAMRMAFVVATLLLAGCVMSARMVSTTDSMGGVQKGPRGGIVAYYTKGGFTETRRKDAAEKMEAYCAPHLYRVLESSEQFVYGVSGAQTRMYVRFECVEG
jgi:hypothetical protein